MTEEWIQKMWLIYTMEYYSAIKNKDIMNLSDKSMKLGTTQMPHYRKMDIENVVHLHNGILLSY